MNYLCTDLGVILTSLTPSRTSCLPSLQPRHPPRTTLRIDSIHFHYSSIFWPKESLWFRGTAMDVIILSLTSESPVFEHSIQEIHQVQSGWFDQLWKVDWANYPGVCKVVLGRCLGCNYWRQELLDGGKDVKMKSIAVSRIVPQNKRTLWDWRMMKIEGDLIIFSRLYLVDILAGVLKDRSCLMESRMSG